MGIHKQHDPFLNQLWLLLHPSEAKAILALEQFLFGIIHPIILQSSSSS